MSFLLTLGSLWTWIRENVIFALTILVLLLFITNTFQCNRTKHWRQKYYDVKNSTKKIDPDKRGPIRRILFGSELFEDEGPLQESVDSAPPVNDGVSAPTTKKCICPEGASTCTVGCKCGRDSEKCTCENCKCPCCV